MRQMKKQLFAESRLNNARREEKRREEKRKEVERRGEKRREEKRIEEKKRETRWCKGNPKEWLEGSVITSEQAGEWFKRKDIDLMRHKGTIIIAANLKGEKTSGDPDYKRANTFE